MTFNEKGLTEKSKAVVSRNFKQQPGTYKVVITVWHKRSIPQNSYLHGILLPIVRDALKDAGWSHIKTIEDAKDFIKVKFLCKEVVNEQTGEIMQIFRHTSELSKMEFSMLVEEVAVWLWEFFQIKLPMPGEQLEMPFLIAERDQNINAIIVKRA